MIGNCENLKGVLPDAECQSQAAFMCASQEIAHTIWKGQAIRKPQVT